MRTARLVVSLVALIALATPPLQASAVEQRTIVMSGLNNPRGLNFGPNGALYVAEAGRGGTQACFTGPDGGQEFAGRTGSISRLWHGQQTRIVSGLASHAGAADFGATGPNDVVLRGAGRIYFTVGLGTNPANRAACQPIAADFGWLARATPNGSWQKLVDVAAFEASANPDHGIVDSNPYGLLAEARSQSEDGTEDGDADNDEAALPTVVTDAGGNSLLAIGRHGDVHTLATFPSRALGERNTDSVPTSVARGPDGALYVGELTGFPFTPGTANVYRVAANGTRTVFRSGFSFIVDIAFGPDGSLYVLQFATQAGLSGPGELWRVTPGGTRSLVAGGFIAPTSFAIGHDGAFYVVNCGVFPAGDRATDPPPCRAGGGGNVVRVKV